ncbi:hypothetical protein GN958_ATG15486 [Phytophthora infestans]|uniref:Uncharacterized protein n=1 Tax=Phytophthora infestans TaxID=4787 RepID=A0A8S9UAL8_PHYIN|nr:hypothetical protein GN958_ATG15486 [Phytophthora infestans]
MPAGVSIFLVFDAIDASGKVGNVKLYEVNMSSDVLHAAMSTVSIHIPTDASADTCETIRPPPHYRQAGTSMKGNPKRTITLGAQSERVTKVNAGSTAQSDLDNNAEGASEHADAVEAEVGDGDEGSDIAAFFDTQLSATTVKWRRQYRCGQCSDTNHNTKHTQP